MANEPAGQPQFRCRWQRTDDVHVNTANCNDDAEKDSPPCPVVIALNVRRDEPQ